MTTAPLRARTEDGLELPILDVTHPAFGLDLDLDAAVERHLAEEAGRTRWARARVAILALPHVPRSRLIRAMARARSGHLAGVATYAMKLGPEHLGPPTWNRLDRDIATAAPCRAMRVRTQDCAELVADAAAEALDAHPGRPLQLVGLAAGVGVDLWNALILLRPRLAGRRVAVDLLDGDPAGPSFGLRAFEVLRQPGAPLAGLDLTVRTRRWDWSGPEPLGVDPAAVAVLSSEGGLFEYADDATLARNLAAAREAGATAVVGSVTRDDGAAAAFLRKTPVPLIPRSREAFAALAASAGWTVATTRIRPFSRQVRLALAATNARPRGESS